MKNLQCIGGLWLDKRECQLFSIIADEPLAAHGVAISGKEHKVVDVKVRLYRLRKPDVQGWRVVMSRLTKLDNFKNIWCIKAGTNREPNGKRCAC